jgi:hypothetical protein
MDFGPVAQWPARDAIADHQVTSAGKLTLQIIRENRRTEPTWALDNRQKL